MKIYRAHFAKRLRQAIASSDCNQADLARALSIESSTVSRWCSGRDMPNEERLAEVCRALKIELSYFDPESQNSVEVQSRLEAAFKDAAREALSEREFRGFELATGERISLDEIYNALRDTSQSIRDSLLKAIVPRLRLEPPPSSSPQADSAKSTRRPKVR